MTEYHIGQIFNDPYPPEAATWCKENNAYLDDYGTNQTIIKAQESYIPTQEEIDMLTMTAWDFVEVLKTAGLTSSQIMTFLNSNPDIHLHLTCCQNVYCGVAKSLMPIKYENITITADMVEQAFRNKYGV